MTLRGIKPAGAVRTYHADFARILEEVWRGGSEYSETEYIRPTRPNGFEYECTDAGQAGSVEPDWPVTIGDTVIDGSIVWTCRDYATNGTDLLTGVSVVADDGLTVDSYSLGNQIAIFTLSGGTIGKAYDVKVTGTADTGDIYIETIRFTIIE